MIIKDREFLEEDGSVGNKLLYRCIQEHLVQANRLKMLFDYYVGEHGILDRKFKDSNLPNNKLVCNHAQYISDMATGYVFGVPVQYSGEGEAINELNDHYTDIDEDSHNNEIGLDMSIYGHALELIYMSNDDAPVDKLACMSPLNSFLVCDSTVENVPMFYVTYSPKYDLDDQLKGYDIAVGTETTEYKYFVNDLGSSNYTLKEEPEEHYFGGVPLIEYRNNKFAKGDFEPVLTLIDAYNKLQSDRINDKEQLVDALLAVTGVSFGDDEEEMTATAKMLKKLKILEIPVGGKAEWLTKNLNETETEVLKKSLKDDIHEFSKVPCLTDENFVGNASGVAMKYKLLGFEQLGKAKERGFKKGLRQRLQLTANIGKIKAKNMDVSKIDITMNRSLPVDDELQARIAQETDGFISWETRVQNYNPELDVDAERKKLDEEKKANVEMQKQAFGSYGFTGSGEVDGEEE